MTPRVPDAQALLAGLQPGTQVVMLSANSDGLTQLADALAGPAQTTDVHIISHGDAGQLLLGNGILDTATLANDSAALQRLAAELGPDSDLLLYGCQTGAGTAGSALVGALAQATGAEVAASTNYVGSAALGGGWQLDVTSGKIDAASPLSAASLAAYPDLLVGMSITTASLPSWTVNRPYSQALHVSGGTSPYVFSVATGSLPTGLSLNTSTGAITGTPTTTSGSPFAFSISVTDATNSTASRNYSVTINAAPTIVTTTLPSWTINSPYSQTISLRGGTSPDTFALTAGALPAGLSLNTSTGAITGTTASGSASFTISVTDAAGAMASQGYSIINNDGLLITTAALLNGTVNQAYSQTIVTTGGTSPDTFAVTSGSLPAGLSLNSSTGTITGTPTTVSTNSSAFTITVTDAANSVSSVAYSITINTAPTIATTTLPVGAQNQSYSTTLSSSGGTAPYTWSVTSGSLPAGLSLNSSTGAITGTPSGSTFTSVSIPAGGAPQAGLIEDSAGDLFGTTTTGGSAGAGSVFEVVAGSNTATTLVSFSGGDGSDPVGALYEDAAGDLFGTTETGGSANDGTVFEVSAGSHALTTVVNFTGSNGAYPQAGLVANSAGDLFGTTSSGGSANAGSIFELSAGTHALTTLVSCNASTGYGPNSSVILDSAGDIFGTTGAGGTSDYGTVYEVVAGAHTLTTLLNFGPSNGDDPVGNIVMDSAGDIFGASQFGAAGLVGQVYELAAGTHAFTSLASFTDNIYPLAGLVMDSAGDLFGTVVGGNYSTSGMVYEVAAGTHALTTLATFSGANGENPQCTLVEDAAGDLFGTTPDGGTLSGGTVFEVAAGTHALTTLVDFNGGGSQPWGSVVEDSAGDLFGTTVYGGSYGNGTVFEVAAGTHALTTLVNFNGNNGQFPNARLLVDGAGTSSVQHRLATARVLAQYSR